MSGVAAVSNKEGLMADPHRFDDEPPPIDPPGWLDDELGGESGIAAEEPGSGPASAPSSDRGHTAPRRRGAPLDVVATLREIVAAQHRQPVAACLEVVRMISASELVLSTLAPEELRAWKGILEILTADCTNRTGGVTDLTYLPLARQYDEEVTAELARIVDAIGAGGEHDPLATWFGLVEAVQRHRAVATAKTYLDALTARRSAEQLAELYRKIEPPTTRKAVSATKPLLTARQLLAEHQAAQAGAGQSLRLSSGLPTLDRALTNNGEPLGFIAPGEQLVAAGLTGTGKTSFFYTILAGMTQDLVNWNKKDAKVVAFHTEEESITKIRGAGFAPGQKFHHLADNLVVVDIGSSRKRIVETLFDLVVEANRRAVDTGRPITDFLPYVVLLDYIQAVIEPEDRGDVTQATFVTAELLMRGVQKWDPDELAKFGGVDFRTYAGMSWPAGMDGHRVAIVTFAQLVKQDDKTMFYKPGTKMNLSDFTLEWSEGGASTKPWVDPAGGKWYWKVEEGDLRRLGKNAIRGHGQILQNATNIVFLHRSRPENNPAIVRTDGTKHLVDTRARLLLEKTRQGSNLPYVPLDFDLDADAFRARFYDKIAEEAVERGLLELDAIYSRHGDPMLPVRPVPRPLAGIRY